MPLDIRLVNDPDIDEPEQTEDLFLVSYSRRNGGWRKPSFVLLSDEQLKHLASCSNGGPRPPPSEARRYHLFPLYKYEHGAVAYSIRSFLGRAPHAEWDSGLTGFVAVRRSRNLSAEKAADYAASLVATYSAWANGEGYGWEIFDPSDPSETLDSCYGYYSEKDAASDAQDALNSHTEDTP